VTIWQTTLETASVTGKNIRIESIGFRQNHIFNQFQSPRPKVDGYQKWKAGDKVLTPWRILFPRGFSKVISRSLEAKEHELVVTGP